MNAHDYLAGREQFGIKFGLAGIRALVQELGNPQDSWPSLLVAGTNGKGSVVAYVAAALRGPLRVGRYTSPHLVRVHERITVDGVAISEAAFQACVSEVREAADRLIAASRLATHPTYFEALTAAAFLHFRAENVGAAVLEVGMGGRLDATNVAEPLVSAIVTVERDHEAYLGDTLREIAREKAGVMRPGRATVLGPLAPEALAAVREVADGLPAHLVDALEGVLITAHGERLDVRTPGGYYPDVKALPGLHQRQNVVVALRLLEEAAAAGIDVDWTAVPARIGATHWPGRLQEIPGQPTLLLDGAHNPAGAAALARHLSTLPPAVLLFGALADKDVETVARTLFPLAEHVVVTRVASGRAAAPEDIIQRAGDTGGTFECVENVEEALARACARATPGGRVVVAGSLYLVGEVLRLSGTEV